LLLGGPSRAAAPDVKVDRPRTEEYRAPASYKPETPRAVPIEGEPRAAEPRPAADSDADAPRRVRPKSAASPMETFRIEVGSIHGIKPSNVVGAIANEAGIEGVHIGRVDIREDFSFVDLPEGMPKQVFKLLQKVMIAGREIRISKAEEKPPKAPRPARQVERKMLRRPEPSRRPAASGRPAPSPKKA
jgi:ATP-dependent RNA helicase DeaD